MKKSHFQNPPGWAIPRHFKSMAELEEAGFSLLHGLPSMKKLINTRERGWREIFNSKLNKGHGLISGSGSWRHTNSD